MEINAELVNKIAKIARLELSSAEVREFLPQLKEILEAFSKLQEVDVKETAPSFQPVEIRNRLREDKTKQGLYQADVLKIAEQKKDCYFKGPKAIS